jgi:Kef-type K+ transport system membrane component KefB
MTTSSIYGLLIIAIVAFGVPFLVRLTPVHRFPASVLEIVAGILIGPSGFGWVKIDLPIQIFSLIGLGFLLFFAGLEINLYRLKSMMMVRVGLGFLFSFALALLAGFLLFVTGQVNSPLFMAILLAATALGMVVPLMQDAGVIETDFGQLVIDSATVAQFGTLILLSLFFTNVTTKIHVKLVFLGSFLLIALALAFVLLRLERSKRLIHVFLNLVDTSAQLRVRGAFMLLIAFLALAQVLGIQVLMASFVAGIILRAVDPHGMRRHRIFYQKLSGIGFGVFVPVFLVATGMQLDFSALTAHLSTLLRVLFFLLALLIVRVLPSLIYKPLVGTRKAVIVGLFQAMSLTFLVAGTQIGLQLGLISKVNAAALIAAGVLAALICPFFALTLLRFEKVETVPIGEGVPSGEHV